MTDIVREEGEIFALEQMLGEKRQLVSALLTDSSSPQLDIRFDTLHT